MAMTVTRRRDTKVPRVFMHRIADIRGGVAVKTSELGGDYLHEGSVLGAPVNGICSVVKIATVTAAVAAAGTAIKVAKGHHFKVGDVVLVATGAKASAISAIDASNAAYDELTIDAALGAIAKDAQIVEAAAASTTTTSALKYTPLAVVGTGKVIEKGQNIDVDAWLIGVTKGNKLPACVADHLKGIINY